MSESNIQTELDLEFARSQFPGLQNGWSFMDNAGGTQIVKGAVERMNDFLFNKNVQIGGSYEVSLAAAEALQACLLYTSPSPRDLSTSRMPSSA